GNERVGQRREERALLQVLDRQVHTPGAGRHAACLFAAPAAGREGALFTEQPLQRQEQHGLSPLTLCRRRRSQPASGHLSSIIHRPCDRIFVNKTKFTARKIVRHERHKPSFPTCRGPASWAFTPETIIATRLMTSLTSRRAGGGKSADGPPACRRK